MGVSRPPLCGDVLMNLLKIGKKRQRFCATLPNSDPVLSATEAHMILASLSSAVQMHLNLLSSLTRRCFATSPKQQPARQMQREISYNLLPPTRFIASLKNALFYSMFKSESNPSARCPPWRCCGCPSGGSGTRPPPPRPARRRCKSQGLQCCHPQT